MYIHICITYNIHTTKQYNGIHAKKPTKKQLGQAPLEPRPDVQPAAGARPHGAAAEHGGALRGGHHQRHDVLRRRATLEPILFPCWYINALHVSH